MYQPREDFQGEIFLTITSLQSARLRRRMYSTYAGLLFSGTALVSMAFLFGGAFVQSEFWSILTLFFSDFSIVTSYWNEFSLLLLETIPVIPLLLIFIPTFIFLLFLGMSAGMIQKHRYSY